MCTEQKNRGRVKPLKRIGEKPNDFPWERLLSRSSTAASSPIKSGDRYFEALSYFVGENRLRGPSALAQFSDCRHRQ